MTVAGCLTNCHSDVTSVHHLAKKFNRPARVALPRFGNLHTKV